MNPYAAYQRQSSPVCTRIDMLLALFDAAIDRTEQVLEAERSQDENSVKRLRTRAQLVIIGLWSGVCAEGGEVSANLGRLYQFTAQALGEGGPEAIRGALQVLRTLREGLEGIQGEAIELERNGTIPPIDAACAVRALV
jgi:flagellin-specific chaperone FliS